MAAIWAPGKTLTSQPQGAVEVSSSTDVLYALNSPITDGPLYPVPGSRLALVSTSPPSAYAEELSASSVGGLRGAEGVSAAGSDVLGVPVTALNAAFAARGAASVLVVCKSRSAAGHGSSVRPTLHLLSSGSYNHYPFTDGNIYIGPFSATRYIGGLSGAATGIYAPHVFVATHRSGAQASYVNGKLIGTGSAVETPSLRFDAGFGQWGTVYFAAFFDRVLSASEIGEFSANPWQIFKSPSRAMYLPEVGGALTVTNVTPDSGATSGGTAVTITGTGFLAGATVTFNGVAATSVDVVSDTTITCVTPAL